MVESFHRVPVIHASSGLARRAYWKTAEGEMWVRQVRHGSLLFASVLIALSMGQLLARARSQVQRHHFALCNEGPLQVRD